ncbi:MAG: hypothetical protein RDV41_08540 [Planctomycetota bacterium]|nr:hypothetical protein [Planctomycetota bacterium]
MATIREELTKHYSRGKYDQAIRDADRILTVNKGNVLAHEIRAKSFFKLGKYAEAQKAADEMVVAATASNAARERAAAAVLKAQAIFEAGDFERAIREAESLRNSFEKYSAEYFEAALVAVWSLNYLQTTDAAKYVTKEILENSKNDLHRGLALLNRGIAARYDKEFDQATSFFAEGMRQLDSLPREPWHESIVFRQYAGQCEAGARAGTVQLDELLKELKSPSIVNQDIIFLNSAVKLCRAYADGKNVDEECAEAVKGGLSRTFVAVILCKR